MEWLRGDPAGLGRAVELLRQGRVLAVPTDTVYGLAALASRPDAVERVYEIKGRPQDRPLVLMAAKAAAIAELVEVGGRARACMDRWWPGALTLVLPRRGRSGTLAVRIPDHPLLLALLERVGEALATTSANLSGEPPALTAGAAARLEGVAAVLDGGAAGGGQPSTLLDLSGTEPRVLRPGPIAAAELLEAAAGAASGSD